MPNHGIWMSFKMSESKSLRKEMKSSQFVICFNVALQFVTNLSVRLVEKYRKGFELPAWHQCGIASLPRQQQTVLRLWLMNLTAALYLRRPFHCGACWWQGLRTHKDTYNPEGNPYLSTGHSPLPLLPTLFYNFCGHSARGLGCHYAVQCLGSQAFTLWFGDRILSLKHKGIKCGLILFAWT